MFSGWSSILWHSVLSTITMTIESGFTAVVHQSNMVLLQVLRSMLGEEAVMTARGTSCNSTLAYVNVVCELLSMLVTLFEQHTCYMAAASNSKQALHVLLHKSKAVAASLLLQTATRDRCQQRMLKAPCTYSATISHHLLSFAMLHLVSAVQMASPLLMCCF